MLVYLEQKMAYQQLIMFYKKKPFGTKDLSSMNRIQNHLLQFLLTLRQWEQHA